jgi:hypothetical protein
MLVIPMLAIIMLVIPKLAKPMLVVIMLVIPKLAKPMLASYTYFGYT